MRDEYDFRELNARKNPYASQLKRQITININGSTKSTCPGASPTPTASKQDRTPGER